MESNDRLSEIYSLRFLGQNYLALGDTSSAFQQYSRAYEILKEVDFPPGRVFILSKYAKLMLDQGKIAQAKDTLMTIIGKESYEAGDRFAVSIYLGECEVRLGEVDKGLKRIETVLDSLDIVQTYCVKVEGLYILGDLLILLDRKSEASAIINKGSELAARAGMKGEIKRFEALKGKL